MKKRIVISESEKKLILKQHLKFANKLIFEQTTNYTIADIKKELNTNYGGKFISNPYNNKFGPTTAGEIVRALDVVKSKGVQGTPSTPASTANTTNTASTATQVSNAQGTTTPPSTDNTATTATTANTQVNNNQGATTTDNTVKAATDNTQKEDPSVPD